MNPVNALIKDREKEARATQLMQPETEQTAPVVQPASKPAPVAPSVEDVL
jgi:hypothetical protein